MKMGLKRIIKKYEGSTSGMEAKFMINELADVCARITKRRGTVLPKELPDITIIVIPDGEPAAKLTLPPVSMSLHYGMYEQAEMILRAMKGPVPVEAFSGRYLRYCAETDEDEEYPELADRIAVGEILIADSNIPKSFLELFYAKVEKNGKTMPISFSSDVVANLYVIRFYEKDFICGWSYNVLTKGLESIYEKCPELLKGMMEELPFNSGVPLIITEDDKENGSLIFKEYTRLIKTVIECTCRAGGDIAPLFSSLDVIEVYNNNDYVTYETELREYVEMFLSEKDLIVKSSECAVEEYAAYLKKMHNALDNVYTSKYIEYDENAKQAAKRIGEGLESTIFLMKYPG